MKSGPVDLAANVGIQMDETNAGVPRGKFSSGLSLLHPLKPRNLDSEPQVLEPAFGLRCNPPVTIEDWPEPEPNLVLSDDKGESFIPLPNGPEGDPEFVERQEPLQVHPDDEPEYADEEIRQILSEVLGDIADEVWVRMCKFLLPFMRIYN